MRRYRARKFALGKEANLFLRRHIRLLPKGKALDIAAGEGRNAVFLALHGCDVDAVDISPVGLTKAAAGQRDGRQDSPFLADLDTFVIPKERYDLIADFYYLSRRLIPRMKKGLRKGGKVIFETYLLDQRDLAYRGPQASEVFSQAQRASQVLQRVPNSALS